MSPTWALSSVSLVACLLHMTYKDHQHQHWRPHFYYNHLSSRYLPRPHLLMSPHVSTESTLHSQFAQIGLCTFIKLYVDCEPALWLHVRMCLHLRFGCVDYSFMFLWYIILDFTFWLQRIALNISTRNYVSRVVYVMCSLCRPQHATLHNTSSLIILLSITCVFWIRLRMFIEPCNACQTIVWQPTSWLNIGNLSNHKYIWPSLGTLIKLHDVQTKICQHISWLSTSNLLIVQNSSIRLNMPIKPHAM